MKKISLVNRFLLLLMVLLAAYEVVTSGSDIFPWVTWSFTVGFGVLVIAGLLLIILGYPVLKNRLVIVLSTLIPLSFSLGLVARFLPEFRSGFLVFVMVGLGLVIYTRFVRVNRFAIPVVAVVHGLSGVTLFLFPFYLVFSRLVNWGVVWISVGSLLIGSGGLLLTFLKTDTPLLSEDTILTIFPTVLLLTTISFALSMVVI